MDSLTSFVKKVALGGHPSKPPQSEEITPESLQKELIAEHENAKLAAQHKGQMPKYRCSHETLIKGQEQDQDTAAKKLPDDYIRAYKTVVTNEYIPSSKGFDNLKPITLKDLLVGTIHRRNYIVLRTITEPVRKTGIKTIVEDHEGLADTLTLFNVNHGLNDQEYLPINSYVAIRAPYYILGIHGYYGLRCDHPSDIVMLHKSHKLVKQFPWPSQPESSEGYLTCEVLKDQGNKLFSKNNHQGACAKYTTALQQNESLKEKDLDMWVALHSNRAVSRLRIFQFDGAISDCEEFDKSARACEDLISEYPNLLEANDLLDKCLDRFKEAEGNFNFIAMEDEAHGHGEPPRLDHADYIGPVEIRECSDPAKGRGLFATRDIYQGELLLCEKAFAITTDSLREFYLTFNTARKQVISGVRARLPCQVTRFIYDNPSIADPVMQLDSSGRGRRTPEIHYTPEGQPVIDAFTVSSIVCNNILELEGSAITLQDSSKSKKVDATLGSACGLWIMTSYLNHNCLENVGRTFIGDFVIIRALKFIKKGDELFQSYAPVTKPVKERQEIFKRMKFSCKCVLCTYQKHLPSKECREREKVMTDFTEFEKANERKIAKMSPDLAPQVRKHIDAIFHSYSNHVFCFELLRPYGILSTLQYTSKQLKGCVNSLCKIIELVAGSDPLADEEFIPVVWLSEYIFYFMYLCIVFEKLGDKKSYEKCWKKAKMLLGIVSGVGYESAKIDEAIRTFRHNMRFY
ncbi:Desmoplakin [Talaromyces islandicus]|uniref:Desmoplakin n=1 Tax=Talaromyces islandicus TaxID=28573 RepID=A0A0U1M7D5_TALIS|nr:Desmoplakin [Talaromyces islandicus]